jgi:hypothetical protein
MACTAIRGMGYSDNQSLIRIWLDRDWMRKAISGLCPTAISQVGFR